MNNRLIERFIAYAKIHTTSDENSQNYPSTQRQFDLANYVKTELQAIGLADVHLDENCYLTATLHSNVDYPVDSVGFCAHFDTSPDFSGENVNPIIHYKYDGGDVKLSESVTMKVADFPFLSDLVGQDLITTDGTTLLGSDDKAGIAEIVELVHFLVENPQIAHGDIKLLFTPDEEVGRGTDLVNLDNFKVDYAYTLDGGEVGELEYENFNAASLKVMTHGLSIHPGQAKDKMINALQVATRFHALLPVDAVPEKTSGRQGFYHLLQLSGDVESAKMAYIIRDHDRAAFEQKKIWAEQCAEQIKAIYGQQAIEIVIKDSYYNMKEKVEPMMYIVDNVKQAMQQVGVTPIVKAIRGGTDGARLSYMGVPTPNICTGGYNFHGRYEMNTIQGMQKSVEILKALVQIIAKN